jgi:dihydroflavonol-4-reductase
LGLSRIAELLREHIPERADKLPRKAAPNMAVRLGAPIGPELRQLVSNLGRRWRFSSAHAEATLGWKHRPSAEPILDCARSVIAEGLA